MRQRTRHVLHLVATLSLAAVAAPVACGETSSDEGPAATTNGDAAVEAAAVDSSTGVRPPDCPTQKPAEESPCEKNDLLCEYGDDFNALCNDVFVCSSGRWAHPIYFQNGVKCPSAGPNPGPNPSDCAASPGAFPKGTCSSKSICNYDGATCYCGDSCRNYPVRMPDCDADAGLTENCCDAKKIAWNCYTGTPYCKTPRPPVGSPCTEDGAKCAMEPAAECGQALLECRDGVWNVANTSCPISSARFKREIDYVDEGAATKLRDDLMQVHLATYRYKSGDDARHLGFIIEDMPPASPAVLPSRDRVDLYGYVSMAVAALQVQEREIDALKERVDRLTRENERLTRSPAAARAREPR